MTRAIIVALAFVLGAAAGVAADRWFAAPAPEKVQPAMLFVVFDDWWPSPPRCPPPSSILPRVTRPL